MIHGIMSSEETWLTMRGVLTTPAGGLPAFPYQFMTSTNWWEPLSSQRADVMSLYNAYNMLQAPPVVVAHSMGAPIARELTRFRHVAAIVTMGGANRGAALVDNQAAIRLKAGEFGVAWYVIDKLKRCSWNGQSYEGPCLSVGSFTAALIATEVVLGAVDYAIHHGNTSVGDLSPSSAFIQGINDHLENEQADEKVNLSISLLNGPFDSEESLGFFRLMYAPAQAVYNRDKMWEYAADLGLEGGELLWDVLWYSAWDDPYYFDNLEGASAMLWASAQMFELPFWYNDVVGGWPHDGFIPTDRQEYPGATKVSIQGISHTDETSNPFIIQTVREIASRHMISP